MFSPLVGSIIMALAVMACLGSLLGWQFTIAATGKAAADERMFPAFFSKVNSMGAPITGMVVLGIVQSALVVKMQSADISVFQYRLNVAVALVAMLYSTYAIYASGKDAVLGGMLVTGIAFIIWGFIAPRFTTNQLVSSE